MADFDVAIVGFGPVGHVAAAVLGRLGHRVGVFERQLSLYPLPRIGHLDHEIMRIVQAVADGAAERFELEAVVCDTYDWINAQGEVLIHFDWAQPEITGWQPHYLFYQPDLDEVLAAAVDALPNVAVHRGWEVSTLHEEADTIRLDMTRRGGGKQRSVTARYLVGADGANSFVRRQSAIAWRDLGFHADWLVVDYRPNDPDAHIDIPLAGQLCDPARPVSMFRRIGHRHCRWEFMLLDGETRETMETPERIWQLLSRWVGPGDGTLVRHAVYTFRSGLASHWRRGRTLLAGDAAHLMPPFLGQGMGAGFRDVVNLAWKLDLVLKGRAPEALLDTYEQEREPHVRAIVEQAVELGKVVCISDPVGAAARDAALISGNAPPPPPFPILSGSSFLRDPDGSPGYLAGELGPQGVIATGDRKGRFDDVVGRGWVLLTFDEQLVSHVQEGDLEDFARWGGRIVLLQKPHGDSTSDEGISDLAGTYQDYFESRHIAALLLRPDFYVYGAARTPSTVVDLFKSFGRSFSSLQSFTSNNPPASE